MTVRLAKKDELEAINILRKQVNDFHVEEMPELFKAGFNKELEEYVYEIWNDEKKDIVVACDNDTIVGYAILAHIYRKETPFMYERDFLDVDEFGVDEDHRRQGIAKEMMAFIFDYAKDKGFKRVELNMWEFNQNALAFYDAVGFKTYRRYMAIEI